MIHKIRIQGFKAIADVTISLGQINVFIGANGSGKSSILEAVGVLSAAVGGIVDDAALSRRGVRLGLPSLYKTSLAGQPARHPIILTAYGESETQCQITLDNPVKQSEPDGRSEILEVATTWSWGSGSDMGIARQEWTLQPAKQKWDRGQWSEKTPEITRHLRETLRAYRIYTPLTPVLRGVAPDPVPVPVLGLSGGGLAELLEDLLAQEKGMYFKSLLTELVDWVDDVEVLPPSKSRVPAALPTTRRMLVFTDRRMREGKNQLSAYDTSEGVVYVLFMLALALSPDIPPFLAVDNAGYGMHPRLVRMLIRRFCDLMLDAPFERQTLLTTHDPLLLDGLPLLDDRVRLFVVERDPKGAVMVRRIEVTKDLWRKKEESGMTLSDLWLEGWLGGVPDLL